MKSATLIAAIAVTLQAMVSLFFTLRQFGVISDYIADVYRITPTLFFLSSVGLMIFFFKLYNKQPKN